MEDQFRCMRCGFEYKMESEKEAARDRVCPKCQSNSVRKLSAK